MWIDCEMTGLDPATDELVEIAVIVTDGDLAPVGAGLDLVIKPSPESLAQMNDFVREMHAASGLLDVLDEGVSLAEAESQVLDYIKQYVPEPGTAQLAGNSVNQDKLFLQAYMPAITEHLHYRIVDVSSVKELARRWYPRVHGCAPAKGGTHRALDDIIESIRELEYYRRSLFPAELNPQSGFYQDIAQDVSAGTAEWLEQPS